MIDRDVEIDIDLQFWIIRTPQAFLPRTCKKFSFDATEKFSSSIIFAWVILNLGDDGNKCRNFSLQINSLPNKFHSPK